MIADLESVLKILGDHALKNKNQIKIKNKHKDASAFSYKKIPLFKHFLVWVHETLSLCYCKILLLLNLINMTISIHKNLIESRDMQLLFSKPVLCVKCVV